MTRHRRTLLQLVGAVAIATVMALAFLVVGGLSPTQAKGGNGNGQGGNHGSTVSSVARSTCTATNPHNPAVSNHGMCVSSVAHGWKTTSATSTSSSSSAASSAAAGTSGTHSGKHGSKHKSKSKKSHSKKTHGSKTHKK